MYLFDSDFSDFNFSDQYFRNNINRTVNSLIPYLCSSSREMNSNLTKSSYRIGVVANEILMLFPGQVDLED